MIEAKPLTEQECLEANLTPKGIYKFKVLTNFEKKSDYSGSYFSLKMHTWPIDRPLREPMTKYDNLFFTDKMMWKTRHAYASIGKMKKYETGKYHEDDLIGAEGYLEIDHRKRKDNQQLESYVKDYIVPELESPEPVIYSTSTIDTLPTFKVGEMLLSDSKSFVDDEIPNFSD